MFYISNAYTRAIGPIALYHRLTTPMIIVIKLQLDRFNPLTAGAAYIRVFNFY